MKAFSPALTNGHFISFSLIHIGAYLLPSKKHPALELFLKPLPLTIIPLGLPEVGPDRGQTSST